jgi:hypothetical protein
MPQRPQIGDLVRVLAEHYHVAAAMTGVVVGCNFSWATMNDSFVVQVGEKRIHSGREYITVLSRP